jgi:haloacetate dehalogenase
MGPWAEDLRGHRIESGHHIAEENPEALTTALRRFLSTQLS